MNPVNAVRTALFSKYFHFSGRAARAEYWYFTFFTVLVFIAALAVDLATDGVIASTLALLVLLVPTVAVTVRRLHDIDRSGWWVLFNLVPGIGFITVLVFTIQGGTRQGNQFGPAPQW